MCPPTSTLVVQFITGRQSSVCVSININSSSPVYHWQTVICLCVHQHQIWQSSLSLADSHLSMCPPTSTLAVQFITGRQSSVCVSININSSSPVFHWETVICVCPSTSTLAVQFITDRHSSVCESTNLNPSSPVYTWQTVICLCVHQHQGL